MQEPTLANRLLGIKNALPAGVELVAVSKTYPAEKIMEAYEAGQRIFGENRPQEMARKYEELPKDIEWHLIGHLQTNKVKTVVPFVRMIHSVDSARLTEAIQKAAQAAGRTIDILLEIHVADEESKSGWEPQELAEYVRSGAFDRMPNLRVRGVMGVATNTDDRSVVQRDFEALRRCKEELAPCFGTEFDTLSMGMSHDYPLAIEHGATMVRIGTAIFGERDYSK
ncbi:MAG: YggS family pyridoxal phosphate-dependent enzyme [Alistipes sp.]|nr:YggS family pyridoxal phosphate-dependent enzyme [Alistipes sp.]